MLADVEHEISSYRSMLPKMNKKRGIINIAGTALKVLFGTATKHDVKTNSCQAGIFDTFCE
jgi:hypothetical protein